MNRNLNEGRRRDGSQASKAKSNKTVDYQQALQNQFDNVHRIFSSIFPFSDYQSVIPPLDQYERLITRIPPVLTKFINRRKCELKVQSNYDKSKQTYVDMTFAKYNPDGRFLFVGSENGIVYLYNSYDFSFHYQYYIQAQHGPGVKLTSICFYPNNTNAVYIGNASGRINFYDNLLHYDITQEKNQVNVSSTELNCVAAASCGTQIAAGDKDGSLFTLDLQQRHKPKLENEYRSLFQKSQLHDICYQQHGKELIVTCGDTIKIVDQRVKKGEVAETYYIQYQNDTINKVAMHRGGNILAACGSDGCRLFDIRNISKDQYKCLYTVKPELEQNEAFSALWHPIYNDVLLVGDKEGNINYYNLQYTTSIQQFDQIFQKNQLETFQNNFLQQSFQQQSQLFSIGYIKKAHRTNKGTGVQIIDMDIHPSGNSLATIGRDKDVRFWTYYGAGSFQNDIFHKGTEDPLRSEFQFNQSHRELQSEQQKLQEHIDQILQKPTKEGEDIFTREAVQQTMKEFINTADERYREAEEANFVTK